MVQATECKEKGLKANSKYNIAHSYISNVKQTSFLMKKKTLFYLFLFKHFNTKIPNVPIIAVSLFS